MSLAPLPVGSQPLRAGVAGLAFVGMFALLGARLHHLQIEIGEELRERGERQRSRTWTIPAARGGIVTADGMPLALSTGTWDLFCDPQYMDDKLRASLELPAILNLERAWLVQQFEKPGNGRRLAQGLSDAQAEAIQRLGIAGLSARRVYRREYPAGALAGQIVGFCLDDGSGGAGIEQGCQSQLAGRPGFQSLAVDACGRPIIDPGFERQDPAAGGHVQLTIDAILQRRLEEALAAALEHHQANLVCGLLVRPTTGEILAMASTPSFDPGKDRGPDAQAWANHCLTFVYESGSTIKPLIAGGAVADRVVGWGTEIDCENGSWAAKVGKHSRTIHSHPHGVLSVSEVVAKSDNIGMAKIGMLLGIDRLRHWIDLFNLGQRTGVELPGEDCGLITPRSRWTLLYTCCSVAYGHEIGVTPLQMAMAHAAVANHGVWLPPRIIRRIYRADADGREQDLELPPRPAPHRVFSPEQGEGVVQSMRLVVLEGTGKELKLDGYSMAGKTGTTEKLVDGHYASDRHIGSFIGWGPASAGTQAQVLALVVVDDPHANGHFGSQTAGPVVQELMQFALEYLKVPHDQPTQAEEEERQERERKAKDESRRRRRR